MLRLASVVVFCGLAAVAQDTVEFEGRYWIPQFSSRLRVTAGGFGTEVDARHDLGIPDTNLPVAARGGSMGAIIWYSAIRRSIIRATRW